MPSITFVDFMFVAAAGFCFCSLSDVCPHSHNQITTPGGRYSSEAIFSLLSLFPLVPDVLEAGDRQKERERVSGWRNWWITFRFVQSTCSFLALLNLYSGSNLRPTARVFVAIRDVLEWQNMFLVPVDLHCSFFCGCTSSSHWSGTNRPLRGL